MGVPDRRIGGDSVSSLRFRAYAGSSSCVRLVRPGMKEGCSGENVLERER